MNIKQISTTPFDDQRPGTSGLRKKTRRFMKPHYVENFIQSVFNTLLDERPEGLEGKTLVVGGDGRYYNDGAIQVIVRMAVANGFSKVLVGRGGLLSTPAASAVIREHKALGGFVLSASHNPGGIDADFGIKFNTENGGPAPQNITEAVFKHSKIITSYNICETPDIDLSKEGTTDIGESKVSVISSLEDYTNVMRRIFDFEMLTKLFSRGYRIRFDAMNAITGPYARFIFEECLGAPAGSIVRGQPLPDFGGCHPDPNLKHAADLVSYMNSNEGADFGAASDGDGDRNLILGPGTFVSPGDSLAVITEHAVDSIPGYSNGLAGVARSMPTSAAVDKVAEVLGIPCYETPTGWKFFCSLMDAGKCSLCGEESFGTGSDHVREKDGLWAVLSWLSIIASTGDSVSMIMQKHWERFGRSYFQRHDFEGLPGDGAKSLFAELREMIPSFPSRQFGKTVISKADDFEYTDPITGDVATQQGIRLFLEDGSRVVLRLSGTGTVGATLRLYLEQYNKEVLKEDAGEMLASLIEASHDLLKLKDRFGVDSPTVIT